MLEPTDIDRQTAIAFEKVREHLEAEERENQLLAALQAMIAACDDDD